MNIQTETELMSSNEYAEYIYEHSAGDRAIGNGDALICAMEEGYLFDSFLESRGQQ